MTTAAVMTEEGERTVKLLGYPTGIHRYVRRDGNIHRTGLMITGFGWTVNVYVPLRGNTEVRHFGVGIRWTRWPQWP